MSAKPKPPAWRTLADVKRAVTLGRHIDLVYSPHYRTPCPLIVVGIDTNGVRLAPRDDWPHRVPHKLRWPRAEYVGFTHRGLCTLWRRVFIIHAGAYERLYFLPGPPEYIWMLVD